MKHVVNYDVDEVPELAEIKRTREVLLAEGYGEIRQFISNHGHHR